VRVIIVSALTLTLAACSLLGDLGFMVQPPRFEEAQDRSAEIRLVGPSLNRPLGGASVRLWATVTNPNRFGFTLSTLRGALFLQEGRAADVDLPLGLPLTAGATETFPIDFSLSFADLPQLADAIRRAVGREPLDYRFDGTVGIDAGQYGRPEFGPKTWLRGTVRGAPVPLVWVLRSVGQ
jgi:hypothetical protein